MEYRVEIKFRYLLCIAFVIHLFVLSFISLPFYFSTYTDKSYTEKLFEEIASNNELRDVIVNINPDNVSVETPATLLSDVDSTAKGHLSKKKGDNWLNNSLLFQMQSMQAEKLKKMGASGALPTLISNKRSDYIVSLYNEDNFIEQTEKNEHDKKHEKSSESTKKTAVKDHKEIIGQSEWAKIPDKKGITLENAIYYNNFNKFSFNTKKFKNFEYFRKMKQKIAGNWQPPIMANSYSGGYTPGRVRIKMIGSEEVKLYFILNRNGDVQKIVLLEAKGSKPLHDSCVDAVRHSKSFGPVPDDLKGEVIVIPFIFGYFVSP